MGRRWPAVLAYSLVALVVTTLVHAKLSFVPLLTRAPGWLMALTNCGALGWVSDRRGYRYAPGTRLSLHQDRDERDFSQPIVSVSLGVPAVFLWGGLQRSERAARVPLWHGDVVVWGGRDRMRFHGVLPVKPGRHEVLGEQRLNLTFRKVR